MTSQQIMQRKFLRYHRIALFIGILFLLGSVPQFFFDTEQFLHSYLFAYLFWLELTLGSMAMLLVYFLTAGGWGVVTRRILRSSAATIYVMAVLFAPILFGYRKIYLWADSVVFKLENFAHKSIYFDQTFFISRAVVYLVAWMVLAYVLTHYAHQKHQQGVGAGGIILLAVTATGAAIDWQMSLDPLWYSTIYGFIFIIGQALGAWAFTLLVYKSLLHHYPLAIVPRKTELDLGNLLLTLVILWAYVSFMQYLIVWSGNLPDETTWFGKRMNHGWEWVMLFLFCFLFAGPFIALLFRRFKTNRRAIVGLMVVILLVRVVERFWMIMPSFQPDSITISYVDISLLVGIGGIWISVFFSRLSRSSPFAVQDPCWPQDRITLHARTT